VGRCNNHEKDNHGIGRDWKHGHIGIMESEGRSGAVEIVVADESPLRRTRRRVPHGQPIA